MTAAEARRITESVQSPDDSQVKSALACWHKAIEKAASAGRSFVRQWELDRPRTPIGNVAWGAALKKLEADGFTVKCVMEGPNEDTIEVSW